MCKKKPYTKNIAQKTPHRGDLRLNKNVSHRKVCINWHCRKGIDTHRRRTLLEFRIRGQQIFLPAQINVPQIGISPDDWT